MAASMSPEYMRERWPGVFADAPDPPALDPLSEAIVAAQDQLSSENWGRNYAEAVVLWAAHLATMGTPARAGGQHHARAGLVEVDYGRETGQTGFLALYNALLNRQVAMRVPDGS